MSVISSSGAGYSSAAPGPSPAPPKRTGPTGVALINAQQTILSFTTPNDGQVHLYLVSLALNVTGIETGGAIAVRYTALGVQFSPTQFGGNAAVGSSISQQGVSADPGTVVSVLQTTALSAGAAVVQAAISSDLN